MEMAIPHRELVMVPIPAGGQGGGTGGEGYVVLESTSTSSSLLERLSGTTENVENFTTTIALDGTGAFGYNGGLSVNYSGGGGGAMAIKLNNTLIQVSEEAVVPPGVKMGQVVV